MRIASAVLALIITGCGRSVGFEAPAPTAEVPQQPLPQSATAACAPAPAACVSHAPFAPPLVAWTLDAPLVFAGTVLRVNASTEPSTPSSAARPLFVVSVDQRLWGAEVPAEVTVDAAGGALPAVGTAAFFFVRPQVYGAGVVTLELARVAPGTFPNLVTDVPEIRRLAAERELYDELIAAQQVVVADVAAVAAQPAGFIGSEHDPVWTDATLHVECTLRGNAASSTAVRFAASDDVAWYLSPKLTAGQHRLLLLHGANADPQYGGTYGPNDPYAGQVVAHQRDSLEPTELQHVVDLLACPPSLP